MGRTKVVTRLGRHLSRGSITLLGLPALVCIALALSTCGSSNTTPDPSSEGNIQAPSVAELTEMLTAELSRLGKDVNKTTSAAPSGPDNAVFDLSAEIIGSREASAYDPSSGRTPNRPAYATGNQDGLARSAAPTQTSSTSAPTQMGGTGGSPVFIKSPSAITGITLSWTERVIGDYDQNGEVNLSDLAPLAINWGANVDYDDPAMHGGFTAWPTGDPDGSGAANWRLARVDGDSNSEINLTDITPIAVHFKEVNYGYQIERAVNYGTGTLEWEALPIDIGFGIQPSAPRDETASYGNDTPVRYVATVPIALPEFAHYFRVKPYDEISDTSGELSNVVQYLPSPTTDTVPPYWLDTVGVVKLLPGNETMTVEFGTAIDDASPPVSYRVFWAEGDEAFPDVQFDYGAALTTDVSNSPYTITGLVNDQYYRVAVRAIDSADVPNIETNTVLLGRKAGATDIHPPIWNESVGLIDLIFGRGVALLSWNAATDSTTDQDGTWESGPVVYRVYFGEGSEPDFQNAQYEDFVDLDLDGYVVPLRNLDTTRKHWFVVRARDQAEVPNEDDNLVVMIGNGITFTEITGPERSPEIPDSAVQSSSPKLVFNAERTVYKLVTMYQDPPQADWGFPQDFWIEVHDFDGSSFSFEDAFLLDTRTLNISLGDMQIGLQGDIQILYKLDGDLSQITLKQYSRGTDEYHEEVISYVGPEFFPSFRAFNLESKAMCLVVVPVEGSDPPEAEYSYTEWPVDIDNLNPFITTTESIDFHHRMRGQDHAKLTDGGLGVVGESNNVNDRWFQFTVSKDGGSVIETDFDIYSSFGTTKGWNVATPIWTQEFLNGDIFQQSMTFRMFDDNHELWLESTHLQVAGTVRYHALDFDHYVRLSSFWTYHYYDDPGQDEDTEHFTDFYLNLVQLEGIAWKFLTKNVLSEDANLYFKFMDILNHEEVLYLILDQEAGEYTGNYVIAHFSPEL